MIRHIIFDIGNVLTDFRWKDFLRDKGFDEAMTERIGAASVESPVWREFDRGEWTEEMLLDAFVANDPGIERELRYAFGKIGGLVTPRDYAIPWLQALKAAGYGVWYLSNFSGKAVDECAGALSFLPFMDGGILSYRDRLIKPDPAIYRLLLDRYGLEARECVFIDDTPVNVQAAQELGLNGIVFQSREQVTERLRELGVECSV